MRPPKEPRLIEHLNDISSDEEIDEDEAFNSEDELKYGEFFIGKKKSSETKKKKKLLNDDDSSHDDDDDISHSNTSSSSSDDDSHSKDWTDDSDQEDDGGQYMLDLLNNLDNQVVEGKQAKSAKADSGTKDGNGRIRLDNLPAAAVHMSESPFAAGAISLPTNTNNNTSEKLTMDSLMSGITDTQGFTSAQRTMRALSTNQIQTTSTPAPRVVSERTSRQVHYEATAQDVSRWNDAVHSQRDAETLDFRVNRGGAKGSSVTSGALVDKFEARTEFEEELAKALEVAGMEDERAMERREKRRLGVGEDGDGDEGEDDLGRNRISVEGETLIDTNVIL